MPGRPKTQRKRAQWEQPKGTKLSRVGIRMSCRICGKNDHNSRRCPQNPLAGNKKMARITREKTKKRKEAETTSAGTKKTTKCIPACSKTTKCIPACSKARQADCKCKSSSKAS